ncbi:MAG: acetyl-CoA C-acetyltransferase [Firmicutes bacterium]|nr:acetyl-CoA C-acetyltransferase [Bacillota bacterium]
MKPVYILEACRTAIGTFGGTLKSMYPVDLGVVVVRALVERAGLKPADVDAVVFGNALVTDAQGGNPARQIAVKAGLPIEVPAYTVNSNCSSGMVAIISGAQAILAGDCECVIAGGAENMSLAPYLVPAVRWGARMGHTGIFDTLRLGLDDPLGGAMDLTAENIAQKYGITREEQDRFAVESHNKAEKAIAEGRFNDEIVPVYVPQRGKEPFTFKVDEHPRKGATYEQLAAMKPAFRKEGTVTAGNASGINDGAGALVLAGESFVQRKGVKPVARLIAYATAGVDPAYMGMGPVPASKKALEKADLTLGDIDLLECNEAFAAQILGVERELKWDRARMNVNGGAIALGHPVGATGAILITKIVYEGRKRNAKYGLATLCVGGGQGAAIVIGLEPA